MCFLIILFRNLFNVTFALHAYGQRSKFINACVLHFVLIVFLYFFLSLAACRLEVEGGVFTFWLVVPGMIHVLSIYLPLLYVNYLCLLFFESGLRCFWHPGASSKFHEACKRCIYTRCYGSIWLYAWYELNFVYSWTRSNGCPLNLKAFSILAGKIGYGTVSEALAYKLPFVFVRRDYFNEEPFLRNMLEVQMFPCQRYLFHHFFSILMKLSC